MPNFFILGAQKAGTTALYHYLKQHPQVYMSPRKETNFFAQEGEKLDFYQIGAPQSKKKLIDNTSAYCELFQGASNERAVGEASPWYLYNPRVPEKIKHYLPRAKLIVILRDPVERAYSHFLNSFRVGKEPLTDFAQALLEEEERIRNNWHPLVYHYRQMGYYFAQLKPYFDMFKRDQIRIYLYEDFKANPTDALRDNFRFLNVDDTFVPDMSLKHNPAGVPKSKALYLFFLRQNPIKSMFKPFIPEGLRKRIVLGLQNQNFDKPPQLSPELRQQLIQDYRDDILNLQDLLQRDLSRWLE